MPYQYTAPQIPGLLPEQNQTEARMRLQANLALRNQQQSQVFAVRQQDEAYTRRQETIEAENVGRMARARLEAKVKGREREAKQADKDRRFALDVEIENRVRDSLQQDKSEFEERMAQSKEKDRAAALERGDKREVARRARERGVREGNYAREYTSRKDLKVAGDTALKSERAANTAAADARERIAGYQLQLGTKTASKNPQAVQKIRAAIATDERIARNAEAEAIRLRTELERITEALIESRPRVDAAKRRLDAFGATALKPVAPEAISREVFGDFDEEEPGATDIITEIADTIATAGMDPEAVMATIEAYEARHGRLSDEELRQVDAYLEAQGITP